MISKQLKKAFLALSMLCTTFVYGQHQVFNKGVGGHNSADLLARVDADVVALNPDLVILMVGTNDMINSKKFVPMEDFLSNVRAIVARLRAANPDVRLALCTILPVAEEYVFRRHDPALFASPPRLKIASLNSAIVDLAQAENLLLLDVHQAFIAHGTNFTDSSSLLVNSKNMHVDDGVHPTAQGYQVIGRYIYETLNAQHLFKNATSRVVCFGDSITYGAFMDGKGTTQGDSYPAQLQRLLHP